MVGVPGVTEAVFMAKQSATASAKGKDKNKNETPLLFRCGLCGKSFKSFKTHAEHLNSRNHLMRASQGSSNLVNKALIKPQSKRVASKPLLIRDEEYDVESIKSEYEREEVVSNSEDPLIKDASTSMTGLNMNEHDDDVDDKNEDDDDDFKDLDPSCCFMCDRKHHTIEKCIVHLHRKHGLFIPDAEYLKDPRGLLTFIGLKVRKDYTCLFCNERCHPFDSLEAVRKHMAAKSHCKVHFGGGDDLDDGDLEDFYDDSSSYVDEQGRQLVVSGESANNVRLGTGGSELIISKKSNDGRILSTKIVGCREFMRYYCQKPRPSSTNIMIVAVTAELAKRLRIIDLASVQSRDHLVRLKALKKMNRYNVEAMRYKTAMKNNAFRKMKKNFRY